MSRSVRDTTIEERLAIARSHYENNLRPKMTLLATIKAKQLEARKARETLATSLLTTLIGEASMPGKNDGDRESTDAEVVVVIKKFIKNTNELLKHLQTEGGIAPTNVAAQATALTELAILETFLPKQMTESQLRNAANDAIMLLTAGKTKPTNMGSVMKALKDEYDGRYDGSMASKIVKELLA